MPKPLKTSAPAQKKPAPEAKFGTTEAELRKTLGKLMERNLMDASEEAMDWLVAEILADQKAGIW